MLEAPNPGDPAIPLTPIERGKAGHDLSSLAAAFSKDRDPFQLFDTRTMLIDAIVTAAVAAYLTPRINARFAVAAVGGYGRRELFPHSDIDLLFVFELETDLAGIKDPMSECLRALWDSGLRVSHSVRTIAECCRLNEQNTELHVSLLDIRFLCGDREIFAMLSGKLPDFFRRYANNITRRLAELARQRHSKFNRTVYHLEPNIKEAPGGIRDIHLLRWLAQLTPQHQVIQESLKDLAGALRFLFALRCGLHFETNRDNNLLTFELQDRLALLLPDAPLTPEEWMRIYYQHARQIFQPALQALDLVESHDPSLLRQFRDWRSRLSTPEFTVSRDRVFLRNPAETLNSAHSVFRIFVFVARHGIKLSWDAHRRLRAGRERFVAAFLDQPLDAALWSELLSQPYSGLALREMQEADLLAVAIPEWRSIDSLVVRDFYHRYTVDEHTFVAVETIDNLLAGKPGTPSRFHELALEDDDQAVLRFAIVLHDIGKGTNPGDHVRGSLEAAAKIMERLDVPAPKQDAVKFLIEHHLDLSLVMNSRDLEDPATARFLTSRVGTQERLRQLTLLTYADISAVNPTAMSPWRLEQLWRVYSLGLEQLTRELATHRIHNLPITEPGAPPELASFLEGLPVRYLRTHTREEIQRHHDLQEIAAREGIAVEVVRQPGAYLITVMAQDQPGLFALICGALASFGMNIVKAEAFANATGCVVDAFRFTDPLRTLELNPGEIERLRWTVECVVRGSIEVRDLLKRRRPARLPSTGAKIVPRLRFDDEASDRSTLIDFVGEDRPGLLYDLASVLSANGCNIEVVMIDTEAHKAIDVFYVTKNGEKLDERTQDELKDKLTNAALSS
ncbi:MAG: HD domain-containing protein [Acidobacteriaceae bacterium]|nr:HD domain-containing protein [Acidobacteriaceae bacterium]